jgi:hypothetical protein
MSLSQPRGEHKANLDGMVSECFSLSSFQFDKENAGFAIPAKSCQAPVAAILGLCC